MALSTRHLLGIKNLTQQDISLILQTAQQFKDVLQRPIKKVPSLINLKGRKYKLIKSEIEKLLILLFQTSEKIQIAIS